MTPAQEKAKELVKKFIPHVDGLTMKVAMPHAKQCATICVDEMVNILGSLRVQVELPSGLPLIDFYQQVKQAIPTV